MVFDLAELMVKMKASSLEIEMAELMDNWMDETSALRLDFDRAEHMVGGKASRLVWRDVLMVVEKDDGMVVRKAGSMVGMDEKKVEG